MRRSSPFRAADQRMEEVTEKPVSPALWFWGKAHAKLTAWPPCVRLPAHRRRVRGCRSTQPASFAGLTAHEGRVTSRRRAANASSSTFSAICSLEPPLLGEGERAVFFLEQTVEGLQACEVTRLS